MNICKKKPVMAMLHAYDKHGLFLLKLLWQLIWCLYFVGVFFNNDDDDDDDDDADADAGATAAAHDEEDDMVVVMIINLADGTPLCK